MYDNNIRLMSFIFFTAVWIIMGFIIYMIKWKRSGQKPEIMEAMVLSGGCVAWGILELSIAFFSYILGFELIDYPTSQSPLIGIALWVVGASATAIFMLWQGPPGLSLSRRILKVITVCIIGIPIVATVSGGVVTYFS